jgi:hypothetical protein
LVQSGVRRAAAALGNHREQTRFTSRPALFGRVFKLTAIKFLSDDIALSRDIQQFITNTRAGFTRGHSFVSGGLGAVLVNAFPARPSCGIA